MFTKVSDDLGARIKAATEPLVAKNLSGAPGGLTKSLAGMKLRATNGANGHVVGPNEGMFAHT